MSERELESQGLGDVKLWIGIDSMDLTRSR